MSERPSEIYLRLKTSLEQASRGEYRKVDMVEVVRCKDCIHYHKSDKGHPDCDWCKRLICGTIKPDFFCADGERKEF